MTKAKNRRQRKASRHYGKPSLPRVIGANDNIHAANDDDVVIRGVRLDKDRMKLLRQSEAKSDLSLPLSVRRDGAKAMADLQAWVDGELDKARRQADDTEAKAVAARHGVKVIAPESDGPLKVTRDGLETMASAEAIDRTQHLAGQKYRVDYERIDPEGGLTPLPVDQSRKIVHGGDGWAQKVRESQDRIWRIHLMLAGVDFSLSAQREPDSGRSAMPTLPANHPARQAIFALDEIAGKGRNLRDLSSSGSVRARLSKALIAGLDCAAIVYELE
ncbi:hypothetical protein [Phenylobacterium sp.]|uniref:hypothetical protein n=1 Tax=Phenylobacterium sp. TaxID=1871053 RepID=UPI003002702F